MYSPRTTSQGLGLPQHDHTIAIKGHPSGSPNNVNPLNGFIPHPAKAGIQEFNFNPRPARWPDATVNYRLLPFIFSQLVGNALYTFLGFLLPAELASLSNSLRLLPTSIGALLSAVIHIFIALSGTITPCKTFIDPVHLVCLPGNLA